MLQGARPHSSAPHPARLAPCSPSSLSPGMQAHRSGRSTWVTGSKLGEPQWDGGLIHLTYPASSSLPPSLLSSLSPTLPLLTVPPPLSLFVTGHLGAQAGAKLCSALLASDAPATLCTGCEHQPILQMGTDAGQGSATGQP